MAEKQDPTQLPGVTTDDPTIPDDDVDPGDVADLLTGGDDDPDGDEPDGSLPPDKKPADPAKKPEKPADKPEAEPPTDDAKPPEKPPEKPQGKTFTEAELTRILQDRLARDRAVRDREIQAATGKTLEQIKAEAKAQAIEDLQTETGWDENRARAHVESQERLRQLEAEREDTAREREILQRMNTYQQQKVKSPHAANPLARQYADEIDQFAEHGAALDYDVAVAFVLGQKVLAGELLKTTEQAAEQKVIREMERKGKGAPESAGNTGPATVTLNPLQRAVARNLGISDQAYARRLAEQQKRTQRGAQ